MCAVWNRGFKQARALQTRRCCIVPPDIIEACGQLPHARENTRLDPDPLVAESVRVAHPTIPHLTAHVAICRPVQSASAIGFWVTFSHDQNIDGASIDLKQDSLNRLGLLSPCERRVALLVLEGCHNRRIAQLLTKSPRTVEVQLTMIYRKLGVGSRTELVRLLLG
jgi:DNA-binding NarL/FixJ family response regulator